MRNSLFLAGTLVAALGIGACSGGDDRAAQPPATDAAPAPGAAAAPAAAPATTTAAANLPTGVTPQMVQEGQQLFQGLCVACHGAQGTGTQIGPALNDGNWIHITGEYEEIVNIITTGVQQPQEYPTPMPPRGGGNFTDDQIRSIAAYVYSLNQQG